MRNNNNFADFDYNVSTFTDMLKLRGYKEYEINKYVNCIQYTDRPNKLKRKQKIAVKQLPPIFITSYNHTLSKLNSIFYKHWSLISDDKVCNKILPMKPIIGFRKGLSIGDILTNSKLKPSHNDSSPM